MLKHVVSGKAFCTRFISTIHFTKVNSMQSELIHCTHINSVVNLIHLHCLREQQKNPTTLN